MATRPPARVHDSQAAAGEDPAEAPAAGEDPAEAPAPAAAGRMRDVRLQVERVTLALLVALMSLVVVLAVL